MRIVFLLPGSGHNPSGNYKIVYEYANGLSRIGYEVAVAHAPYGRLGDRKFHTEMLRIREYWLRKIRLHGGYRPKSWFSTERAVKLLWLPTLHFHWLPDADICVATSWETAEWLNTYPESKGKKFYLLQHLETHYRFSDEKRIEETWKLPMQKIVIAKWLQMYAQSMSQEAAYIPNGLDFERFNIDTPINERQPAKVMMLYHNEPWKGTQIGLMALKLAKQTTPELNVTLFGIDAPTEDFPPWIKYYRNPSQNVLRKLYNEAAIFLSPSFAEGWPLPPAESMQCGAALCATDIGGHREYATDAKTALISPAGDIHRLAENLQILIRHVDMRIRIATDGNKFIRQFTWQRAVRSFQAVIDPEAARK